MYSKKNLPKISENISEWYNKVIMEAALADYGPVKGTMIIRPYGYAIWENVQKEMDKQIKLKGIDNGYFPLFIPESFLNKEKDHVKGFAPELAVVTFAGGEELSEKIVVRPTSETIMYDSYAKWIQSWRDLPLQINQWNNVVRWEKRTHLFLRTSEFLWQEGHTAHGTQTEAIDTQKWAMNMYADIYKNIFALPGLVGKKSESEKFAGAVATLTYESLMPDGKALQSCTSHDLGQNFSKVFEIKFQDKNGDNQYVWQTSWGFSTRSIGGLIMAHGDDQGLKLPPMLAPIQIVIIPVKNEEDIINYCNNLSDKLKGVNIRVKVDTSDETMGSKINTWELKGVPVHMEIGRKEMESQNITIRRRDTMEKSQVSLNEMIISVEEILKSIQNNMYNIALKFLSDNTHQVNNYNEFKTIMNTTKGFIKAFWCENESCELSIKEETKATTRCLPVDTLEEDGQCIYCEKKAKFRWVFAQSY